jgi:dTMP kinase
VTEQLDPAPKAPFIPPTVDEAPMPPAPWRVLSVPGFRPLISAQFVSSLGDWTGLLAIIAIANDVSKSGFAVGLVMIARMAPGLVLAPIGGAFVDRWNRKVVMVSCDIGRFGLLILLPFWDHLLGLVVLSFCIEVLTLLWSPAKDASVPNIVTDPELLPSANSLGVVAAFGTFPLGAIFLSILAVISHWLGGFEHLHRFREQTTLLPIWFDAATFLVSASLISRLRLPEGERGAVKRVPFSQTFRDIREGLSFIRSNPLVRGVMIGLAGGLFGGGMIIPLGPLFATDILGGSTAATFGTLMVAFGLGAATGVIALLLFQRRLPREPVFTGAVIVTGAAIIGAAWVSELAPALFLIGAAGAGAGCGYVTGFTLLQENVADELRGRTFATLYTVVRLCLLLALALGPFFSVWLGGIFKAINNNEVNVGSFHLALPGVRLALWFGGLITVFSGIFAGRRMRKAHLQEAAGS